MGSLLRIIGILFWGAAIAALVNGFTWHPGSAIRPEARKCRFCGYVFSDEEIYTDADFEEPEETDAEAAARYARGGSSRMLFGRRMVSNDEMEAK